MFTHVKRTEGEEKVHFSHLFRYVSAYQYNKEMFDNLVEDIEGALIEAKRDIKVVVVDQDGEHCFHVYPSGQISLMLRWKNYEVIREKEL